MQLDYVVNPFKNVSGINFVEKANDTCFKHMTQSVANWQISKAKTNILNASNETIFNEQIFEYLITFSIEF